MLRADSDVQLLGLSSTRGGDKIRRSPAAGEARQTAAGNAGNASEEGAVETLVLLVTFSDLGSAVGKSRHARLARASAGGLS